MANYTLTPEVYQVYNEFDKHGLLLGLSRLQGERNAVYKQRLFDVFANRADSTYRGLINGITRELGLSIIDCIKIIPRTDADGVPLLTMPAVTFQDTKCYLYSDFENGTLLTTIDRWERDGGAWDLRGLTSKINDTGYFEATLLTDANDGDRSMTIFNQSSVELVTSESISGKGVRIMLDNNNLIPGTVSVSSSNMTRRVFLQTNLRTNGDYLVDLENGIIYTVGAPVSGSYVRYQCRNDEFIAKASPVILHNLQSNDFKTKMFEQVVGTDGETANGRTTPLGADILNELLSVYPSNWGG